MSDQELFAGTRSVPPAHALDEAALHHWLQGHLPGYAGPLSVTLFKGGQSNPTYQLTTPQCSYVMRTKPGPSSKLLPSAHAIEREFAVMRGLQSSDVPVPAMLALCEDESIVGRSFYIMEFMAGRIHWDPVLPGMTPTQRHTVYDEMNRVIAALHRTAYADKGLADFGKAGNYFERQIKRWTAQYQASVTQPIVEMDRLMDWLPQHIPPMARDDAMVSIVHGDYRLDNVMFAHDELRVVAVLDWELSTLGHPLADFSYHCMTWHIPPGVFRGIHGLDHASLGIPTEAQYIAQYCERTGFATPEALGREWNFYMAYNLFRIAAILQGIAKRIEMGTAASAQATQSAAGARPLAQLAWQFASRA
ncbi:MAG: phosphotransferase family protein [Rhodoferax sp.]|nr:phosphotransferase family protein [Rhodoferax sp.]